VSGRRTNLALLVLVVAAIATGFSMWGVGSGWGRWPTVAHGAAGLAVVALSPWKAMVTRRGVRRRGLASSAPALALSVLVTIALVTGFVHRAGVRDAGPLLVMQLHVGAALISLPLVVWHVVARPIRPRRADFGRRAFLRAAAVVGGTTALTVAAPHAGRARTRSLERGSSRPSAMPVTQWLFDPVPVVDGDAWRLRVGDRSWSLQELEHLAAARTEMIATLDCTGGWYAEQQWGGVPLDRLLDASDVPSARTVEVRSVTGYRRRFPWRDIEHLLVATRAGGQPLSAGHGYPARLVAPDRRGFWWVKWLEEIAFDDRPWWWQPPFPLT
jgi:DMSO/TMAO reductase YedYZ molybdopterin-dependent catalytic subunit